VQYLSIEPRKIILMARLNTRRVKIVPEIKGQPAKGFQFIPPLVRSESRRDILLIASPSVFASLGAPQMEDIVEIQTGVFDLKGRDASFSESVELKLPPGTDMAPGQSNEVRFSARIREVDETRDFTSVTLSIEPPIASNRALASFSPGAAQVSLKGPRSVVKAMRSADLSLPPLDWPSAAAMENETTTVSLRVTFSDAIAEEVRDDIEILSIRPEIAVLTFVPANEHPQGN